MDEPPPYHLEIEGLEDPVSEAPGGRVPSPRPWVGIWFDCCGVYTRVYRNPSGTAYHGYCPRCTRGATLRVGENGTDARFFVAE